MVRDYAEHGGKQYDTDKTLDWFEYSLDTDYSTYRIEMSDNVVTEGMLKTIESLPFVTVVRSQSNKGTGYYIEDYYSTEHENPASLREQKNTMQKVSLDGLDKQYHVPIIHYKNSCQVKLLLKNIDKTGRNNNLLQYKIDGQTVSLGNEFSIQTKSTGQTVEIKDANGNVKGKIEFRQISEGLLSPTLNIVTINETTLPGGYDFSSIVSGLNGIYNTINVNWQRGVHIPLTNLLRPDEIQNFNSDDKIREKIINALEKHSNYKKNEYYMILVPIENSGEGGYTLGFDNNYFYINKNTSFSDMQEDNVSAHELGHCNGLDEISINIGVVSAADRVRSQNDDTQFSSSNVMGYRHKWGSNSTPYTIDFYSWQIPIIRENIKNRMNKK